MQCGDRFAKHFQLVKEIDFQIKGKCYDPCHLHCILSKWATHIKKHNLSHLFASQYGSFFKKIMQRHVNELKTKHYMWLKLMHIIFVQYIAKSYRAFWWYFSIFLSIHAIFLGNMAFVLQNIIRRRKICWAHKAVMTIH